MSEITREQAHHMFAMHIRNRVAVRFTPPADDAGPAHQRDGEGWLIRLSPGEADTAARAAVAALEDLGVLPRHNHAELAERVDRALTEAGLTEGDGADFGWQCHRSIASGAHLLLTCEPSEAFRMLPGQAVRQAIAQHLAAYTTALAARGLGVVAWGRGDQDEVLIVAADQDAADRQAPDIIDYLLVRNPPAKPQDGDGDA